MSIKLQTDGSCNIVACPMTGYELRAVSDTALLIIIEYVETEQQFETGERKTLQAIVKQQQALELAETLQRSAKLILTPSNGTPIQ